MFTGIVETTGTVENIAHRNSNIDITISCNFTSELEIDQSVAHDGCCLTVVAINEKSYKVTAIAETLEKTNLSTWQQGTEVNLERCVKMNGRLDGHIVQGHVDQIGRVKNIEDKDGSFLITIEHGKSLGFLTVPQGSITVNGISLTVAQSGDGQFTVAIIPYTWQFTNLKNLKPNSIVNLEFDIIGKYVTKLLSTNGINKI